MRSNKEILQDLEDAMGEEKETETLLALQVELLLDIRDSLQEKKFSDWFKLFNSKSS